MSRSPWARRGLSIVCVVSVAACLASIGVFSGCGEASSPPPSSSDDACPRGEYFFCRCAADVPGTKLCRSDGSGFDACSCASSSCEPGEEIACGCDDATTSTAICDDDGAIGACVCSQTGGSAGEDCPGKPLAVPRSATVKIAGNTAKARSDRTGTCGGDGPEQVFQLVPGGNGSLRVEIRGIAPLDAVVYAFGAPCGENAIACIDEAPPGGTETLDVPVSAGAPVFVVVDSFDAGGSFVLAATLTAEGPPGDVCPGVAIVLAAQQALSLEGTTKALGDDFAGNDVCAAGKGQPDSVYAVTAQAKGTLRAKLTPKANASGLLYASDSCGGASTQACGRAEKGVATSLGLAVAKGDTTYVVVDGVEKTGFDFSLDLLLEAP
jgi:hypothetical protein